MIERFKRIRKYPNYKISSFGRVYSTKTKRFLIPFISNKGYTIVTLCVNGKCFKRLVHRLVAKQFLSSPKLTRVAVNHIDGNKLNNTVNNLQWVTNSENILHAYNHKLNIPKYGENHFAAKLSNIQVSEIRQLLAKGLFHKKIALAYNVSTGCISNIKRGISRKHD